MKLKVALLHVIGRLLGVQFKVDGVPYGAPRATADLEPATGNSP